MDIRPPAVCAVRRARMHKIDKYKDWPLLYPGIPLTVFTVSTFGVIHPDTERTIIEQWRPKLKDNGAGFLRALRLEFYFLAAKYLGSVLHLATVRKSGVEVPTQ